MMMRIPGNLAGPAADPKWSRKPVGIFACQMIGTLLVD